MIMLWMVAVGGGVVTRRGHVKAVKLSQDVDVDVKVDRGLFGNVGGTRQSVGGRCHLHVVISDLMRENVHVYLPCIPRLHDVNVCLLHLLTIFYISSPHFSLTPLSLLARRRIRISHTLLAFSSLHLHAETRHPYYQNHAYSFTSDQDSE